MLSALAWTAGSTNARLGFFAAGCALYAFYAQYSTPNAADGLCYNGRAVAHTGGSLLP